MLKFNNTRSIPAGYYIPFSAVVFNKDTNSYSLSPNVNFTDNSITSTNTDRVNFSGYSNDYLIGFRTGFEPTIKGGFYSEHIIDFSRFDFRYNYTVNGENRLMNLTQYAIPTRAYAIYDGVYDYQIYDGDVDYDRWIYDNNFSITKPINISFGHNDVVNSSTFRGNVSLSVPSLSVADLLDVTSYRNQILSGTSFDNKTIEDFSYERVRISCDVVTIYVLYSIDDTNFAPYNPDNNYRIYDTIESGFVQVYLRGSETEPTLVNISAIDYLDNTSFSLKNIANGISLMAKNISSSMSNVVTNATDNANRIIQNTTQKVDEVKQGVTEVKDSVVETKNSILDLPNKIKEMLIGLVVPDDETINSKYAEFETLLSDRFGLIYQSADIIHDFADSFQTQAVMTADTGGIITMPQVTVSLAGTPFTFGGYEVDIIPDGFEILQHMCRLAVSMVCTVVFINMLKSKLEWILR